MLAPLQSSQYYALVFVSIELSQFVTVQVLDSHEGEKIQRNARFIRNAKQQAALRCNEWALYDDMSLWYLSKPKDERMLCLAALRGSFSYKERGPSSTRLYGLSCSSMKP